MRLISLQSSSINGVSYDHDEKELYVLFQTGKLYRYMGVDADAVTLFLFDGVSQGSAFQRIIAKSGHYPYEKLDPADVDLRV